MIEVVRLGRYYRRCKVNAFLLNNKVLRLLFVEVIALRRFNLLFFSVLLCAAYGRFCGGLQKSFGRDGGALRQML